MHDASQKSSTQIKLAHGERLISKSNKCNTIDYSSRRRTGMLTSVINDKTESGDSSVVTRWTADQKIVGSHPIHARYLISVVWSLSGFTLPIR